MVLTGDGSGFYPGFGYAVADLGDASGDGVSDIAVGAPYEGTPVRGTVKVYSGATGALLFLPLTHPLGWNFGFSVAGIGDVNGDSRADVLVGDLQLPGVASGPPGQAFVYSGADGSLLHHVIGSAAADEFGWSVSGIGDIDQDGAPDWAAGAVEDHDSSRGPGYVRLCSGATGATIRTYTTTGTGKRFGQSLVNAGDVNADGVPDLLIGASGGNFVQMRSGLTGAILWQKSGPGGQSFFGWDVDLVGDWNADGSPDVAIGAPSTGIARILRSDNGATLTQIAGPPGEFFGGAVAGLGDVDHDGYSDLAIGAKWVDVLFQQSAGAAWIYSGLTHGVLATFLGKHAGDYLGFALSSVGDLDGDGIRELAIGATQDSPGPTPGFVAVYSGAR